MFEENTLPGKMQILCLAGPPWSLLDGWEKETTQFTRWWSLCSLRLRIWVNSHLLLNCSFARQIWYLVLQRLRWHSLTPNGRCFDLATWWTSSRKKLTKVDRKAFDTLVILTSWMIWNERNRRTFDSRVKTVHELWTCILDEAVAWDIAGFKLISTFVVASGRRSLAL